MKQKLLEKYGIGIFFLVISLTVLIVGVIPNAARILTRTISGDYIEAAAVITKIDTKEITPTRIEHSVYVSFATETSICETLLDTYVEGMTEGDEINLLYHRDTPEKITLKWNQELQLLLFFVISALFGSVGIILMKRRAKLKALKTTF